MEISLSVTLPAKSPGLSLNEQGVLVLEGKPYRGMGVNYFDLFYRCLKDPEDTSFREGLSVLSERKIPFARFMCGGFWPKENALYFEDREEYFKLLDEVIEAAQEAEVGLIPSLFWHSSTVPDLVGESVNQWGNPQSKTHAFMKQVVAEVVERYKESPAIWAWEFGNEYNLGADLPNAKEHRPAIVPELGTPESRSADDELSRKDIRAAFQAFASAVRTHDPHRIITTGNAFPRPSAWHQTTEGSWTQDSLVQFAKVLLADQPDPIQMVSVHLYDPDKRFHYTPAVDTLISLVMGVTASQGKILFIGEFGARDEDSPEAEKARFKEILTAIEKSRVPLAALWVYDFGGQKDTWNVTDENSRAYQLDAIEEANQRIRSE